jgi:hypothetical protein
MSKKQTIRTLGTKQNIKPIEILEEESDNDIQKPTEKVLKPKLLKESKKYLEEEIIETPIETPIISKKKRNLTEEQKEVLRERLAHARSLRRKGVDEKQLLEQEYLKQKEEEINDRLLKKFTSLQRKKESEMMKQYLTKSKEDEIEYEEEPIIIKKKRNPKKKVIYQYDDDDEDDNGYIPPTAPPAPSICFC